MMQPLLIGIGGKLASGKDTAADHLVSKHGFVKIGMSDPLHEAMATLNPIISTTGDGGETRTYNEATKKFGYNGAKAEYPEYRRLLQVFGTELARNLFGEDVWVEQARSTIEHLMGLGLDVVVTGIRYPNEAEMIRSLGGRAWWIVRPTDEPESHHASENSVDSGDFDIALLNFATLKDFGETVDRSLELTFNPNHIYPKSTAR